MGKVEGQVAMRVLILISVAGLLVLNVSAVYDPTPGGPPEDFKSGACEVSPTIRTDCHKHDRQECIDAGCCWVPNEDNCPAGCDPKTQSHADCRRCPFCFKPGPRKSKVPSSEL